jgi:hypothetical protein
LGRDKAKSLVQYVETKIDKRLDEKNQRFFPQKKIWQSWKVSSNQKIADTKSEIVKMDVYFFGLAN